MKHVVSFSSGAVSALAAKRVAEVHGTADLVLLFADVNGEHPDNYRFLREAAAWIGGELVILDNGGRTIWDAFREARFLGNTRADICSRVLKREPLRAWLEEHCDPADTTCHLGFDWTEEHRFHRSVPHWKPWTVEAPLLWEPVVDKGDAIETMRAAGIEPPLLTRLGFPHANCGGGCVKAGMRHWRKLLHEMPEQYAEWERNEAAMSDFLDRPTPVTILRDRRGGQTRPLSLRDFRLAEGVEFPGDDEWGACGCLLGEE